MEEEGRVRIDKWLWASRFFKTRSAASQAVTGGHVQVNGNRVKASRMIAVGEVLRIRRGEEEFVVTVTGVSERRGAAAVAQLLYSESDQSREARDRKREERKLFAAEDYRFPLARPNKRDRRLILKILGKGE